MFAKLLTASLVLAAATAIAQPARADHVSFGIGVGVNVHSRVGGYNRGGIVVGPGPYVLAAPVYYAPPTYYSFGPTYFPGPVYSQGYCYPQPAYYAQPYAYPYVQPWAGYSYGMFGVPSFTGYGVYRTWNGR